MIYGCIGEHLSHSFSKEIHEMIHGYPYEIKEIPKDSFSDFMKASDFRGINVTIPYKQDVIPYMYQLDDKAKKIGAVNTVVNRCGKLYGYNTDFEGMCALAKKANITFSGKKVLILGSGGTSKTATCVSETLGASSVYKLSRNPQNDAISYEKAYSEHSDANVIINTTPCGMYPKPNAIPIDLDRFGDLEGVIDAVYNPLSTRLVMEAARRGIRSIGGLYMLVAQAVFAAEKFTGEKYGESLIDKVYEEIKYKKENIVLIGMPGCGKSTVGKILSQELGKCFIDTDIVITERYGEPQNIIKEKGIEYFRKIESEVIDEVSNLSGAVISTGGGSVLLSENVYRLKQNGKLYFIDRALKDITPTDDRPLSSTKESLENLYKERYGVYSSACDFKIEVNGDACSVASEIMKGKIQ